MTTAQAPYSLDEIRAIAVNLPKYNTTRTSCECPDNAYRGRERWCKHINVALILLGGLFPCVRCGRSGGWLNQNIECANGCDDASVSSQPWCVSCGAVVDTGTMRYVEYDGMYAHAGDCAKKSGLQDEIDRASLASLF